MTRLSYVLVLLAALASPGCLKQDQFPTDPSPISADSSEIFTGTISPGGSQLHTFNLTVAADTTFTLASLTMGTTTLSTPLALAFGTASTDGATCTPTTTVTVSPALTAQITQALVTGMYCVTVTDSGNLPGDAQFAVRIRHTLNAPVLGTAGTETFSTNLYPGGRINRTFSATASGDVKVELTAVAPQASVGIGIGVTNDTLDDCFLNKIAISTPGSNAQLTAAVQSGAYCVKVFDAGAVPDRVNFTVQITHP